MGLGKIDRGSRTDAQWLAMPVTALILTYNEGLHIERCLSRVVPYVERVVVVDSFSTDQTLTLAQQYGADILQRRFTNHAEQFQWGLDECKVSTAWVMKLDADEYFEETALSELRRRISISGDDVSGFEFRRKVYFQDRWMRHGRAYSAVLLRVWRNGRGSVEQRWMDEHVVVDRGRVERIKAGDLVDHNLNGLTWWIEKHNRYATRNMIDLINAEVGLFVEDGRLRRDASSARTTRWLKSSFYDRAPLYLRALMLFLYRYIFCVGFLDGRRGLIFHFMQGLWFRILVDAKVDEARRVIAAHGVEAFKRQLLARDGIRLG